MQIKLKLMIIGLSTVLFLNNCDSSKNLEDSLIREYGIFYVLEDNTTIEMDGSIDTSSLDNFNRLTSTFKNITDIDMIECDGSLDDEINLLLSAKVHQKKINIHLIDNCEIASGGVDFFLAGIKRTRGENTRIGVHAWEDDVNKATDFPKGHAKHLPYIDYFVSIGLTQKEAEDFYYFTIYASKPSSLHWMNEAEIAQYKMLKY